ncbi:MAG TPA: hypothetical protein VGU90_10830, partial [Terriglobales bacterium]|nr:hypothetical protein [Terriglobales bacterium]
MKRVLLVHPADSFASFNSRYDLVVDLGHAPASTYADWSRDTGCPVVRASRFRNPADDLRQLREVMRFGMGQVLDANGLDWWDLISLEFNQQMEHILQLRNLVSNLGPSDEVSITRSGFHARVLQLLLDRPVQCLSFENGFRYKLRHYPSEVAKFSP